MIDFATFLLSYWISRINVFRVIVVGRLGEYDFHISTLMISHIYCNCQKNFNLSNLMKLLRIHEEVLQTWIKYMHTADFQSFTNNSWRI